MKTLKVILFSILIISLYSCDKDDDTDMVQTEFKGSEVNVGDGQAWSYVRTDEAGVPVAIGIQFTESALTNLPTGSEHGDEFLLRMPDNVEVAPYDHLTLDWNEHGHEPMNVYDRPHFDMHFYFMSEAERNEIGPFDSIQFNRPLPAENLAPNYLETPGGVPRMGAHIIDLMSPEIAGTGIFTHTFIYGKYDAQLNFLEPMVTKEFLDSKVSVDQEIRQPASWQESGYYPHRYTVNFDEETGLYTILLTDLHKF